jgi:hypothetical protein
MKVYLTNCEMYRKKWRIHASSSQFFAGFFRYTVQENGYWLLRICQAAL